MAAGSDATPGSHSDHIERQLKAGRLARRRLRIRFGATLLSAGLLSAIAWEFLLRIWKRVFDTERGSVDEFNVMEQLQAILASIAYVGRYAFESLVLLETDSCITRVVIMYEFAAMYSTSLQALPFVLDGQDVVSDTASIVVFVVSRGIVTVYLLVAFIQRDAGRMQSMVWNAISLFVVLAGFHFIAHAIIVAAKFPLRISAAIWMIPAIALVLVLTKHVGTRQWVQARLLHMLERRVEQHAAAGIAVLVGDCSDKKVIAEASQRFRSVTLAELSSSAFMSNTPAPALFTLSSQERLGHCDAFISHSWQDDHLAKWEALSAWRRAFVSSNGREPRLWFDRCCIDQCAVDRDLRCLPIFLSGCKKLVVLCGPTYLSRLWCIVELFTFVHMDRSMCDIELISLFSSDSRTSVQHQHLHQQLGAAGEENRDGDEEDHTSDLKNFVSACNQFDATNCMCSVPQDKDKMLSIIRAAFGDLSEFNEAVRSIFKASALQQGGFCRQASASSCSSGAASDFSSTFGGDSSSN